MEKYAEYALFYHKKKGHRKNYQRKRSIAEGRRLANSSVHPRLFPPCVAFEKEGISFPMYLPKYTTVAPITTNIPSKTSIGAVTMDIRGVHTFGTNRR